LAGKNRRGLKVRGGGVGINVSIGERESCGERMGFSWEKKKKKKKGIRGISRRGTVGGELW